MAASKHTTSITTGLAYSYWSVQTLDAQKTGRDWPVMSPTRTFDSCSATTVRDAGLSGVGRRRTIYFTRKALGCISVALKAVKTEIPSNPRRSANTRNAFAITRRVTMTSKIIKYAVWAGMLASAFSVSRLVPSMGAQQSATSAVDALQKARVLDRLAAAMPTEHKGTAPGFVLDPAWPQPLPHHWVIGDVGGIAVDKHDHIWVYHRPRSVSSTDSGMQGATAKDARGRTISDLGFPRPNGQLNGCCMPAPSVLEFDQAGKLLQAWGGPGDPGFLKNKCNPERNGCTWPAREHGIYIDQNDFVYIAGNGQAVNFHGQNTRAPKFRNDSQILKFKTDGTFVLQIGTPGAKGPNSNDTNGGIDGTPEPFWPADMVVDPKTNYLYVADGYGNRRVLIVDAATGKYVGHFGAYGQNQVQGENGRGAAPA